MMIFLELWLIGGLLAVSSNPSPYFAALGLVSAAGTGCLILTAGGATFLSLVLFLVYLGGMLVVFAYSAALVAEPHPEAWGSTGVVGYLAVYTVLCVGWWVVGGKGEWVKVLGGVEVFTGDWFGVSVMYTQGGKLVLLVAWAMLLTLFAVLEVVRGHYSGALRAV